MKPGSCRPANAGPAIPTLPSPEPDPCSAALDIQNQILPATWRSVQAPCPGSTPIILSAFDRLDQRVSPCTHAAAFYWVRTSAVAHGLDERLGVAFRAWLAKDWPFAHVAYPGRDIAWSEWLGKMSHGALSDKG